MVTEGIPIYGDRLLRNPHKEIKSTDDRAFRWSIAPRLVVTREDAKMAATNELFVIETKDGVVCVKKIWMEDNLNSIVVIVEELHSANLVENRVVGIINHIVSGDRRKGVSFESQDTTLQKDAVFLGQKFFRTRQCTVLSV